MPRHRQAALHDGGSDQRADRDWDWRDRSHWNGGRRRPCWVCGHLTFLLDHRGQPAHKVCIDTHP